MKPLIITVLIMMLIWQGCHSFFPVGESQKINLNDYDAEDIQLDLVDGTDIISEAYMHKLVAEPSDFIMGIGSLNVEGKNNKKYYYYNRDELDSIRTLSANGNYYAICYLKNSNRIIYEEGSYLRISPKDGTGYFINGEVEKDGIQYITTMRVDLDKIQKVEIKKIDGFKTAIAVILTSGILFAISKIPRFDISGIKMGPIIKGNKYPVIW